MRCLWRKADYSKLQDPDKRKISGLIISIQRFVLLSGFLLTVAEEKQEHKDMATSA